MLLLVGGLPPGPDRLPSNLVQYYDDEKKTWKILTSELQRLCCFFIFFSFLPEASCCSVLFRREMVVRTDDFNTG